MLWLLLANDCLWELVPHSNLSPICAVLPSSAYGKHLEPRLPGQEETVELSLRSRHSRVQDSSNLGEN